jgi:hypothetical protein
MEFALLSRHGCKFIESVLWMIFPTEHELPFIVRRQFCRLCTDQSIVIGIVLTYTINGVQLPKWGDVHALLCSYASRVRFLSFVDRNRIHCMHLHENHAVQNLDLSLYLVWLYKVVCRVRLLQIHNIVYDQANWVGPLPQLSAIISMSLRPHWPSFFNTMMEIDMHAKCLLLRAQPSKKIYGQDGCQAP